MKLAEIFSQLASAEFSQLGFLDQETRSIPEDYWNTMIDHTNLGLVALYKRFLVKESRFTIRLVEDRTDYYLKSRFAVSNESSTEPIKFIEDDPMAPFKDDIGKVERVYTDSGTEMLLNDLNNVMSLHTPTLHTLRVPIDIVNRVSILPERYKTSTLQVNYRALPKKIVRGLGYFSPDRVEVELPEQYLQALLLFIASRAHNPIGMMNEFHSGNSYAQKYEMECQRLEGENIRVDQVGNSDRLYVNGWV